VTGARKDLTEDAQTLVQRLRKVTKIPVAVGFGISAPDQFASVGQYADAAVIGSAIVQTIEQSPGKEAQAVAKFIERVVGRRSSAVSP
jgi:tryptophan synthase alpha chain